MTLSSTLLLTRCLSLSLSSSHSLSTYLLSLALSFFPFPSLSFSLCVCGCVSHSLSFFSPTTLSISPTPREIFQLSHFPPLSWCLIIFLILLSFLSSDTCEKFVWTSPQWIPLKGSQSGEDKKDNETSRERGEMRKLKNFSWSGRDRQGCRRKERERMGHTPTHTKRERDWRERKKR